MTKQLTTTDLDNLAKTILKEIDKRNFATKKDLESYATKKDVEDVIHNQLTEFHYNMILPEMQKMEQRLTEKIDNQSKEFVKKKDIQKLFA